MYYYFLFRKIIFSLLVLAGLGVLILLVRFYWGGPGEQPVTKVPIIPPADQEKVALAPPEVKTSPTPQVLPTSESVSKSPVKQESPPPLSPTNTVTIPAPITKVPSPSIEKKSDSKISAPEPKAPLKEEKKVVQDEKAVQKTKPTPPENKKSETKNGSPSDHRTLAVKAGDSIYTIAQNSYRVSNTSVVDRILEVNPKIADPDLLPANQKIRIPDITEESLVAPSSNGSFTIRLGTFMKPEYASFLKGLPALQGKEIKIAPLETRSGKTLYRATAGPFESREEGLQVIRELKEKGLSPYFEGFQKKN
jgi:phage tail protein X